MPKNGEQQGQGHAAGTTGRRPVPMEGFVNIGPALVRSHVTRLYGRPYPVQSREQGAIDAWTQALVNTGFWRCWRDRVTLCREIRPEVLRQLEAMSSSPTAADYRERRKGALDCVHAKESGYVCYLGVDVVTGKNTYGTIC